uniref:Mitochondrial degradasome RNA helicase subunit C-terminal domain-containing protein n=1 Tax=Ditylenchus dipsaci TaxID=166011 RepID=A0A915CSE4_9BILA
MVDDQVISYECLHSLVNYLLKNVSGINGLNNLSVAHDTIGMYLWLSYRYPGYFPDVERVRQLETVVEQLFQKRIRDCFGSEPVEDVDEVKELEQEEKIESLA